LIKYLPMDERSLAGLGVLVTRPKEQAPPLSQAIADAGGHPIAFPTIEIAKQSVSAPQKALLNKADTLIFTSVNAVHACSLVPSSASVIAMGPATAAALKAAGWSVSYAVPVGSTSEDLLQADCLQALSGRQVALIGGEKPRGVLQAGLRKRGAQLQILSVYRRLCPKRNPAEAQMAWPTQAVVSTSLDSFRHLVHWLGPKGCSWLSGQAICVPSQRIADLLEELPFVSTVLLAKGPQSNAIVDCLTAWWATIR
jgi:uroporphyrinogen-III synthase